MKKKIPTKISEIYLKQRTSQKSDDGLKVLKFKLLYCINEG